jgi:hypothetical protein
MGAALNIPAPRGVAGNVYLIHLERGLVPAHGSTHYIGWASEDGLWERIETHAAALPGTPHRGSPMLAAANERGIRWSVVRIWRGADRHFERKLKRRKKAKHLCPVCRGEVKFEDARYGEAEVTHA